MKNNSKKPRRVVYSSVFRLLKYFFYLLGGGAVGARPKAHIKLNGEEWIVKFACRIDPKNVGEKEFIANQTAEKCGINVNEYKLFPSKLCTGYFGVKRFDRKGERRVHTISLAALLETTHKYQTLTICIYSR